VTQVELIKELLKIENKFAAISSISKHSRRLREFQQVDKAESQGLHDYVAGTINVDEATLPEFLRDEEVEIEEGGQKKKAKRKKKR